MKLLHFLLVSLRKFQKLCFEKEIEEVFSQSVTIQLEDEIDIVGATCLLSLTISLIHLRTWMPESAGSPVPKKPNQGGKISDQDTTKTAQAMISEITYKVDVNSLRKNEEDRI